jgi:hypothetical protein
MTVIDFKFFVYYGHSIFNKKKKGMTNEYRENGLCSINGLLANAYVSRVRPEIPRQLLRIKSFYGTSESAVKTQIWIAISVYVLVAIVKKRLHLDLSLYTILQILSVTVFEKSDRISCFQSNEDFE